MTDFGRSELVQYHELQLGNKGILKEIKPESDASFDGIEYSYRDRESSENSPSTSNGYSERNSSDSSDDVKDVKHKKAYKEMAKNRCPENCAVCGDTAVGYHYEVPSCNGCKTFFRRTILSGKQYECKKDGKCFATLPKERRCACRGCRFQQCVDVGMNPLAIAMTDKQAHSDTMKEVLKRRNKEEDESIISQKELRVVPVAMVSLQDQVSRLIDELSYLEIKSEKLRACSYNPEKFMEPDLDTLLQNSCAMDLAERVGPMPQWPLEEVPFVYGQRPPHDKLRKNWLYYDLMVTVEYAKTFPFFHRLSYQDRRKLLCSVGLMTMNLTQAFQSFKQKCAVILHPDGTKPLHFRNPDSLPVEIRKNTPVALAWHSKAINHLLRNETTEKEYLLMKAIVLCNAGGIDLSDYGKTLVLAEQKKLTEALLNYCLNEYGAAGPARFATNVSVVDMLEHMARDERDFHLLLGIRRKPHLKMPLIDALMRFSE